VPKANLVTTNGLGFEDAVRKMLNTPPSSKSAKLAAKKHKRKNRVVD